MQGDDDLKATLKHQTRFDGPIVHTNSENRTKRPLSKKQRRSEVVDLTTDSADQDVHHQIVHMNDVEILTAGPLPEKARQSEVVDLTSDNRDQDEPSRMEVDNDVFDITTRKSTESVDQFLARMPVSDKRCAQQGPWLWIHGPNQMPQKEASVREFVQGGAEILRAFGDQRDAIESQCRGKTAAVVGRKLKPLRDQLKTDLLNLATALNTTCGKWMLFPGANDVSHDWRLVAKATADGKLGQTSKVATWDPSRSHVLICVYTPDFNDVAQIKRVLQCLVGLGLRSLTSKPIYYKCDAYTYLSIEYNNPYKLKASLYSSNELLDSVAVQHPVTAQKARQSREYSGWDF
jgi:hypothetical protein